MTVDCLRVAGGILLFTVALDVLHARVSRESVTAEEIRDATEGTRLDFSDCHTLVNRSGRNYNCNTDYEGGRSNGIEDASDIVISLTFALSYLIFRFANKINKLMGVTGSLVITRVMGLLLGAIAVNFVSIGVWNIYRSMV